MEMFLGVCIFLALLTFLSSLGCLYFTRVSYKLDKTNADLGGGKGLAYVLLSVFFGLTSIQSIITIWLVNNFGA